MIRDRPAIAVLPFSNMSDDTEQDYFSDGISEDMITALSKLRWFLVIARNSSFTDKGKCVDVRQIGEELGVGYVLEGSVRKIGEHVRITAQLNDVSTGSHVWASVTTATPRTYSPFKTRSRRPSSLQSNTVAARRRKIFTPAASNQTAWMRGSC